MKPELEKLLEFTIENNMPILVTGAPGIGKTDIIKNISPNKEVHVTDDVQKSVELVLRMVNDDELILVTGSLYLVGEARDYWIPKDNILNCLNVQEKLRVQP